MVVLHFILFTIRKQQNKALVLPSFIRSMFISSSLLLLFFFFFQIFSQKWYAFLTNEVIYSVYFQKGIKSKKLFSLNVLYHFRTFLDCWFNFSMIRFGVFQFFQDSVYDWILFTSMFVIGNLFYLVSKKKCRTSTRLLRHYVYSIIMESFWNQLKMEK